MTLTDQANALLRRVPVWLVYIVCMAGAPWLFWLGVSGGLGPEPVKGLERELGELALKFLVAGLAVTPLRRFLGLNLMRFRRAIGLVTFFYVCCHLLVWLVLDVQLLAQIWADIVKRPYITVGMAAFVLLVPLAVTSNNRSVRRLGPAWRRLHRLVYPAAILGGVHYLMLAKGFRIEPLVYLALIAGLLLLRLPFPRLLGSSSRVGGDSGVGRG
ncbi:protein-methionine-sulfoxide reductase heme-binding subunit MsrQ [Seohaeicola zhoushanensis]|uniref:Protein-methionine-sulfoxide reductase heme-binding subunit MsrQ n=1 Tax=Seohaeicola zhoushanensis TaxID=1569283 RepID=A0A8J3GSW5_9RHOB|nr:protein-methionine-sulfoxide reductase heme-binding subunit MsrQ [Seohaeicola zhoushanensis]GHF32653.1 protein-methionine-sulfoxide reductase heme-binding subunit MsrQ [Seohaeicola zhoushanensis]